MADGGYMYIGSVAQYPLSLSLPFFLSALHIKLTLHMTCTFNLIVKGVFHNQLLSCMRPMR